MAIIGIYVKFLGCNHFHLGPNKKPNFFVILSLGNPLRKEGVPEPTYAKPLGEVPNKKVQLGNEKKGPTGCLGYLLGMGNYPVI